MPAAETIVLPVNADKRNAEADAFIACTGADVRHGAGQACYNCNGDFIMLPAYESFQSADGYYATAIHELIHWTGAKDRLDRTKGKIFGDAKYAAEELVAELGASFLCAEFGFDTLDQNAAYIDSWIELLKSDPRAIFTAASAASKAADYLRGLALAEDTIAEAA